MFDEIVSVEFIESNSLRFDIEVANNHNFFANGILVHNCQNIKDEIFGYEDILMDFDYSSIPEDALKEHVAKGLAVHNGTTYQKIKKAKASPDTLYEVTLKLDGTSCTYFKHDEKVGVCSRNLQLKVNEENIASNALVKLFVDSGLQKFFIECNGNMAFQGELMGPSIQGNRENLKHPTFYIFDMYDINRGVFLTPDERHETMEYLYVYGINKELVKHVPIIANAATLQELGITDTESLIKYAEGPSINHAVREGVVFKRIDGGFSFKSISNTFLAKEKD